MKSIYNSIRNDIWSRIAIYVDKSANDIVRSSVRTQTQVRPYVNSLIRDSIKDIFKECIGTDLYHIRSTLKNKE